MSSVLFAGTKERAAGERVAERGSYLARLVAVLGDGRQWEYRGECVDLGPGSFNRGVCSCSHTGLRYLFTIHHKANGKTAIVGSTCIEHYAAACPEMVGAIARDAERFYAADRDRVAAAKRLAGEAAAAERLAEFSRLAWELDTALAVGAESYEGRDLCGRPCVHWRAVRRVSRDVWLKWHRADVAARRLADRKPDRPYPFAWTAYKRRGSMLRQVDEMIVKVRGLLAGPLWEGGGR